MKKFGVIFLFTLVFIALLSFSQAATIYGNIYGPDLNLLKYSIVEINSSPKQNIVAINGNYSFDVPAGIYEISVIHKSKEITLISKETITINSEGKFIYDLILFDTENVENITFDEKEIIDKTVEDSLKIPSSYLYFAIGLFIALAILIIYLIKKKQKTRVIVRKKTKIIFKRIKSRQKEKKTKKEKLEEISHDEILNKIYAIIKKDKRITQKEIRKQIGMSEAKISLVIADLESRGLIKKIKAGRGNIISIIE